METVFYYTSTYFLDISLEIINVLKAQVNLHVLIEITPSSKNANIINVEKLPADKYLSTPQEILSEKDQLHFADYFSGTKSVYFVVHNHPTGLSLSTLKVVGAVKKYIRQFKPTVIHFEGFTLRTLGLAPLLFKINKLVLAVHDAMLHSGEATWKSSLPRFVFFRLPVNKTFVFYSAYSMQQFASHTKHSKANKVLLQMHPFSYYNKIASGKPSQHNNLLFFGRISKYKGVDILLDAMPLVLEVFPAEKLIIAGKGADDVLMQHPVLQQKIFNTTLVNRYLPNEELVGLIKEAKMVICPYIDASQSGVLMTAFALHKPVIASNVGAFSEQIKQDSNGCLVEEINSKELAQCIIHCLQNKLYLGLENNLQKSNQTNLWNNNIHLLKIAYTI